MRWMILINRNSHIMSSDSKIWMLPLSTLSCKYDWVFKIWQFIGKWTLSACLKTIQYNNKRKEYWTLIISIQLTTSISNCKSIRNMSQIFSTFGSKTSKNPTYLIRPTMRSSVFPLILLRTYVTSLREFSKLIEACEDVWYSSVQVAV